MPVFNDVQVNYLPLTEQIIIVSVVLSVCFKCRIRLFVIFNNDFCQNPIVVDRVFARIVGIVAFSFVFIPCDFIVFQSIVSASEIYRILCRFVLFLIIIKYYLFANKISFYPMKKGTRSRMPALSHIAVMKNTAAYSLFFICSLLETILSSAYLGLGALPFLLIIS